VCFRLLRIPRRAIRDQTLPPRGIQTFFTPESWCQPSHKNTSGPKTHKQAQPALTHRALPLSVCGSYVHSRRRSLSADRQGWRERFSLRVGWLGMRMSVYSSMEIEPVRANPVPSVVRGS